MEGKDSPQQIGKKEYNEVGKTLSLILRMCRHIFGPRNAVVLYSGFFVAKGITYIKSKGVNVVYLIKKRR